MHIVLKVLASTSIKRRKPWPRITWIGEDKETLILLGNRRISVLFIGSGETKRKVPSLQTFIKDCVSVNYSGNGHFFVGLLSSGKIILWHKDSDHIIHVDCGPSLKTKLQNGTKQNSKLYVSNDGQRVLLVTVCSSGSAINLWQFTEKIEDACNSGKRQTELPGAWWCFDTMNQVFALQPTISNKDLALDASFIVDLVLGNRFLCGLAYTLDSCVHILNLNIRWLANSNVPVHYWQEIKCPLTRLASDAQPTQRKGAHVLRWSHDGRVLALATNQESGEFDNIVFLSPHCDILLVANFPKENCIRRHHRWVCDMTWTHDDLFIVTINNLGSICLLSRLGEPLTISTKGCSVDLSAAKALNIHPFIYVRPPAERVVREDSSSSSTVDIFKQRFSVCCHPRLPLFLCSDGYMVTCLQLPQSLSDPLSFIRTISQQAYKYMHLLRKLLRSPEDCLEAKDKTIPLTTSFYKSSIKLSHFDVLNTTEFASRDTRHIDDEEQSSESDSTSHLLSENLVHRISAVGTHDSGTLIFGTQSKEGQLTPHINNNNDFSLEKILAVVEKEATVCIFRIWGIMVTYSGPWTIEWEMEAKVAAELLLKLCSRLINLYSGNVLKHHRSFEKIFSLVNSWLSTCHFNALDKTVMVLILNTVKELLKVFRIKIAELPVRRRIKQSIALFRFLELMEKNVTRSFGQHVDQLLCSSNYSSHQYSQPHFSILSSLKSSDHKSVVKQRFTVVWRIFYKDIWKLYNVTSDNRVALLLGDVQKKFQKLRCSLELNKPKISVNDEELIMICSPEKYKSVVELWKKHAEKTLKGCDLISIKKTSRIVLAMLYTLLRSYRIQESISLLYWLVTREASNDGIRTLQNPAVSVVLTSFARFMALYFINEEVFVYSFLCPRHFPRLHHCRSYNKNTSRKLPLCYQTLFKNLNNHQFARHWTPDVTVSLFLITGNIEEASNFALQLGDWKTAIVLHYASQTCGKRLRMKKKIQTLLTTQLCNLVDWICDIDDDQDCFTPSMITTLKDWLLAGAFCDVDVVPTVLSHLIRKLDLLIRHLPLFVSPGIHLPSPPPYCPHFSEHDNMSMDSEESCRKGITRMVQLFLTVLRIINCDIPVIHSYLSYLQNVIFKMSSVKGRSINLDWPLQNIYNKLINYANVKQHQKLDDDQLTRLVSYFRDMCTICWFLHTRDNVNQHLRKLWQNQQDHFVISYPAQFCLEALQWASHLAPFSSDVGWGLEVYHLIVSLLLEAPQDRRASHVLARCFPDGNPIPADIDYRIRRLAESWRGITVKVPSCRKQSRSSRTLFLIYQEQREEVNATQNRLKETFGDFEPVSQMSSNLSSQMQKVKSFETEKDYLVFLALMLDVGIIKDRLEEESPDIPIPILNKFRYQLAQIHQNVFVSKDISDERKRLALRRIHIDAENLVGSSFPEKQSTDSDEVCSHLVKRKLFRSTSLDEVQLESRRLTNWSLPLRNVPLKAEKRTQSLTALSNDLPERKHKGITKNFSSTIHPKHSSLLSLCEAMDLRTSFNKLSNDKTDDEEMANTLAWLLRWAKDEHDLKYVRDGRGTPTVKLSVTLRQLLWAVRQRKMPAFSQELNVSRSLSDIHTDSPGLSIENFPQIDIRVTRRHQMNKFERRRRQGVTLFEDSTDFNNLRRLESTDRSNWILKSRQESKEKNSSCTIDATSFTMDRSLEELEVAANKVTNTDNSIEYSTSTTEQTRNEQRHIAFVKLNSHGSKHIVDTSRPVVDDALLLSKNKTTENPQNGVCTLNERSKAVWEDSKRNGTASPIEDESVEVTTTSKWTDDSQSLFIPCESGPENRISAYFLKYANDKETSELDSTLTSTSTNEFLPQQIRNPILKDASVQANENDNMKGVLKSPTVESSIVLARPIDTTTFLFMKDATSSSNVRTWTSRSATDMWTQTESQSEQDVLSDKVDEPDWQQSKFLRLPAEKEMCARCEPSTNVHLNRDQPPVIINEKPVSQPRIPTLLKLDQSPRFNRVSVPPFQEESQTRRKLLTLREVLDLRDKLVVRTGDEKKHQSLQGRSRGPMIPTLLRNRLQTHSLTAPEKWRNGFVNVDESGGSTLIDLSSRQKPRPNIVNGEKRKSKITPPLTKCCSCQTVETAHNDVSTLTDARVVQDTATETCLESPKIMVSFGMNTIEGETKEDDNVKINNSITQKEVIYRSLLGNVACGTQTDDNDEEIQTRDVGTNPELPVDSIHSPAVNKALTNGSLLMEHPDRSTKTIDSTLDNDTERGKDFNLQKMKDRLQYLTNHGFLDLISPTVRSKQTVVKKTRFVNDSQHDNAVGLDTMQHLKIMSSFPHKQENDCIKNNDSLSTNKLQKDKRQELLNEHFILRKPMAQTLLLDLLQQEVTDVSQPPKPSRPAAQPLATKRIPENVSNMTNTSRYRSYPTGAHIFRGDPKRNDVQAQFPQRTMLNRTPAIRLRRPPNSQNRGNVLNERSSHQKGNQHKLPENNVTCVVQSNHSSRSSSCETLSVWTVEDEIKKLIYGDEFNQKGGEVAGEGGNRDSSSSLEESDGDSDSSWEKLNGHMIVEKKSS